MEAHGKKSVIDIITTSGRSCSSVALNAMIAKITKGLKEVPTVREQVRERTEQPTDAAMSTVNVTELGRDDQTSLAGVSVTTGVAAAPSVIGVM